MLLERLKIIARNNNAPRRKAKPKACLRADLKVGHYTLAWGPAEIAASEKMQVEMENGLAGAGAVVEYGAVAGQEIALGGEFGSYQLQLAKQRLVGGLGIVQRDEMFLGANQNVHGRLRVDVFEGEHVLVLIDELGGNLFRANFAE
ncbi:MAG TPA: hypothetical protein VK805_13175 [Candidatus Baltobacteraceae bacterium]|nr:hypothetical protein [Candidatus Baltobacteraceae bacterium]